MSKIDTINEKLQKQRELIQEEGERRRASDLGFDDIADYRLWQALEDLRQVTLTRRRDNAPAVGKAVVNIAPRVEGLPCPIEPAFISSVNRVL